MICCNIAILGYWDIGILGYWDIGILGYWDIGILGYWDIGILGYFGCSPFGRAEGTLSSALPLRFATGAPPGKPPNTFPFRYDRLLGEIATFAEYYNRLGCK